MVDFSMGRKYNEPMKDATKRLMAESMNQFSLPRYDQLPDMGLYLEQAAKYINQRLEPLGLPVITSSMIRNYVKMGLVNNPFRKQYYADQLAHLMCVTILKQVVPLEHVSKLFEKQRQVYSDQVAYDYFCMELENILQYRFGLKDSVEEIGETQSLEKEMLRSAITAVSHVIFLNACFEQIRVGDEQNL